MDDGSSVVVVFIVVGVLSVDVVGIVIDYCVCVLVFDVIVYGVWVWVLMDLIVGVVL